MHTFLTAIGFVSILHRKELNEIIAETVHHYDSKVVVGDTPEEQYVEFRKYFGDHMGIAACGEFDDEGDFYLEYYYPFLDTLKKDYVRNILVKKQPECNALNCEVMEYSLCFPLEAMVQNPSVLMAGKFGFYFWLSRNASVKLSYSALSRKGTILFPVHMDEEAKKEYDRKYEYQEDLWRRVMDHEHEAMSESAKNEYRNMGRVRYRLRRSDLFSIVTTSFKPLSNHSGECEILGDILSVEQVENPISGEEVIQMVVNCNGLSFNLAINRVNLMGTPMVGFRFRGIVWMQVQIDEVLHK